MCTEDEVRALLKDYKPPFHHEVRDEIIEKILRFGEKAIPTVTSLLMNNNKLLSHHHYDLLFGIIDSTDNEESLTRLIELWENAKPDLIRGKAKYTLTHMERSKLQSFKETYPDLVPQLFRYFSWERVDYCQSKQPELIEELQALNLTLTGTTIRENAREVYRLRAHTCPICNRLPDDLTWIYFWTPFEDWTKMCGRAGWLTTCDDCHTQVDFFTEQMN